MKEMKKSMKRRQHGTPAFLNTVLTVTFSCVNSVISGSSLIVIVCFGIWFSMNFVLKNKGIEIAMAVRIAILREKYKIVASKSWSFRGNVSSEISLTGSTIM